MGYLLLSVRLCALCICLGYGIGIDLPLKVIITLMSVIPHLFHVADCSGDIMVCLLHIPCRICYASPLCQVFMGHDLPFILLQLTL